VIAVRSLLLASVLLLLAALPKRVACQSVPILDDEGGAIGQCMERIRSIPERSVAVAEKRLGAGGLAPQQEIAWLGCLGMAMSVLGKAAEAIATVGRMQGLVDTHWGELTDAQRFDALSAGGDILQNSGEAHGAADLLGRAYALALTGSSTVHRIHADEMIAVAYLNLDAPEAALRYITEARALSEGRAPDQAFINYYYALTLTHLKRYDEALALYGRPEKHLNDLREAPVLRYRIDTQRAVILAERGEREEATSLLESSLAQQRAMNNTRDESEEGRFLKQKKDALDLIATIQTGLGAGEEAHAATVESDATALAMLKGQSQLSQAIAETAITAHRDGTEPAIRGGVSDMLKLLLAALAAATGFAVIASILAMRTRQRLETMRRLDPLTGLDSRATAIARFNATASATGIPRGAVLLIVINKLDSINDLYGYETGERVLSRLAMQLSASRAQSDFIARWSDDGFLIVVDNVTAAEAQARARELCDTVERGGVDLSDGDALRISISIGISSLPFFPNGSRIDWHDSLRLAGRALQSARRTGASAWACIWGVEPREHQSTVTIAQAPQQAADSGQVRLEASSPRVWQT
jgi:diguanylate cyclase (GGDEF)-like protein